MRKWNGKERGKKSRRERLGGGEERGAGEKGRQERGRKQSQEFMMRTYVNPELLGRTA